MITLEVPNNFRSSYSIKLQNFGPVVNPTSMRRRLQRMLGLQVSSLVLRKVVRQLPGLFVTSHNHVMPNNEKNHLPALVTDPRTGITYDFGALFGLLSDEELQPIDLSRIFEEIADSLPHAINEGNCELIVSVQNALYWIVRIRNAFRTTNSTLS